MRVVLVSHRLLGVLFFICIGTVTAFCWTIVTGCCIPRHIKGNPDRIKSFLQQLCIAGMVLSTGSMGIGLAIMTKWLTVHGSLTLSYERDGCSGDACPHLGGSFWAIFSSVFLLFFCSFAMGIQTKSVSSKMHEKLGDLLTIGGSMKEYAEKKARYDYAVHRMGKDWAEKNLKEPKGPKLDGVGKLAHSLKDVTGNVTNLGVGFVENLTLNTVDINGSDKVPAQAGWVDPIQLGGGFRSEEEQKRIEAEKAAKEAEYGAHGAHLKRGSSFSLGRSGSSRKLGRSGSNRKLSGSSRKVRKNSTGSSSNIVADSPSPSPSSHRIMV